MIHDVLEQLASARLELEGVQQAHDEQAAYLEVLARHAERKRRHEDEYREMLLHAQERLVAQDVTIQALRAELGEMAARAERAERQVTGRDATIRDLRTSLDKRDHVIRELRVALDERTTWAQRAVADVAARDATIHELQARLEAAERSVLGRLSRRVRPP